MQESSLLIPAENRPTPGESGEVLYGLGLGAQIDVVWIRIHIMTAAFVRHRPPDHDQLVGMRESQRPKQNGIDDAEDRAVRADA